MRISFPAKIERIVGPLPGQGEARAVSLLTLTVGAVLCALSLYSGFHGETLLGRPMGNDFVQFYAAGQILNRHEPALIYDTPYLVRLEHKALPEMAPSEALPFAYPPAIAQLFRPLALLPYGWAFCVWLVFSMVVYASGLWLLFRDRLCASYRRTAFLLSLSAPAFMLETWMGGQISVLTFFAVVLFVSSFENRWLALAGLALGFASYKPSLIAVPAAAMILGGCWRMLGGLGIGTALMALASIATAGIDGVWLWVLRLRAFGSLATSNYAILPRTKYVDLNSFFAILLGGSAVARAVAAVSILAAFGILAWAWWQSRRQQAHETQRYLWAATLTWTLIINIYVPVYDTILLVPVAALVARSLAKRGQRERAELQVWLMLLWLVSWLTQPCAHYLRLQILTVVVAGFGYWALTLARANPGACLPEPLSDDAPELGFPD
jgi:hypothetical protein